MVDNVFERGVTLDNLISIIGAKEVDICVLRSEVEKLRCENNKLRETLKEKEKDKKNE